MNNPLMGGLPRVGGSMGNVQQIMQQFNQFRQTFRGNPQQQVQQLLSSGKVSQEAYNNAYQMAQQFQKLLEGK